MATDPWASVGAQPGQPFTSQLKPDAAWRTVDGSNKGPQYKDIFGILQGRNIVFCLDTSGSMYEHLSLITAQLGQVLADRLQEDKVCSRSTQFNMIAFSVLAHKWSTEPVVLNEATLDQANQWMRALVTESSTNTLDALLQAFSDCTTDCVYLVTDGLPDQRPALVVECVLRCNKGRPLISVSIGAGSNGNADLLLTDLASVTGGSYRPVTFPLKLPDPAQLAKLPKGAVVTLHGGVLERGLDTKYLSERSTDLRWQSDIPSAYPTVRAAPPPQQTVRFPVTAAGRLMFDKPVIARRSPKGDYQHGLIIDQHSTTQFEVKFSSNRERCELCHIFIVQDALMHPVNIGDHVLAPLKAGGPYEPGNVVRGSDTLRGTHYNGVAGDVMVVMYSGVTVMARAGTAMWISKPVYNRMVTEMRVVPNTKSSMEAVEALKISERHPTSPGNLEEYLLSKNNEAIYTDVCPEAGVPFVQEVPNISIPCTPCDYRDDNTDKDTIITTLSQLAEREEEMGRVSMDGGYDELLGVPDHPRFNEAEEEKEVKPAVESPWQHTGRASEGKKSPTSKPLRPMSASVSRGKSTYRGDYTPNKIDMTFRTQTADTVTSYVVGQANGRPSSANVMPIKRAKPTGDELRTRHKAQLQREREGKEARVAAAKERIANTLKEQDAARSQSRLDTAAHITKETRKREEPSSVAQAQNREKQRLKNAGSHQQGELTTKDNAVKQRTTVTIRDDVSGRFKGYKLSTKLSSGELNHYLPPTIQRGSVDAEHHAIAAVSHAVQTDNRFYVSRVTA